MVLLLLVIVVLFVGGKLRCLDKAIHGRRCCCNISNPVNDNDKFVASVFRMSSGGSEMDGLVTAVLVLWRFVSHSNVGCVCGGGGGGGGGCC